MRKVFFSVMFGQELLENEYVSDDFDLKGKQYLFPITYLVRNNVKSGDSVLILTSVEKGNEQYHRSRDNYRKFQKEVQGVLETVGVKAVFKEIWTDDEFTATTSRNYFKEVVRFFADDDVLYADITFGIKIFNIASLFALAYVAKANSNVDVKHIVYAWKYSSAVDIAKAKLSKIYDVTSLFYLNQIAGTLNEGDRSKMDKILGI